MRHRRKIRAIRFKHRVLKLNVRKYFIKTTILERYNAPNTDEKIQA